MAVAVQAFQRRAEQQEREVPEESAIDKLLKGLQIAGSAMGLYTNLQQAKAYKQQQEAGAFELGQKKEAVEAAKQESALASQRTMTEPQFLKLVSEQKVTPVGPPKMGQEQDPSVLQWFVRNEKGEDRPVYLRQMKPFEGEAERAASFAKQEADQQFKRELADAAQKNKEKLQTMRKTVEKAKEPSPAEIAKVQQAEAMMVANDALEERLQKFDPTSRFYIGQMRLPIGTKKSEWQEYETSARQFVDPIARVRTGAAMPEHEFSSYMQQYFPMPGDSQEMVKQKAVMRQKAIDEVMGMGRRARTDKGTVQKAPTKQKTFKASHLQL